MLWNVYVRAEGDGPLDPAGLDAFAAHFEPYAGAVTAPPAVGPPSYSAQFDVEADDVAGALRAALDVFAGAVAGASWPAWPIVHADVEIVRE